MSSVFSKIIKGDIPSYKIAEDDNFYAFLDINPNAKGHTLCVPKVEVDKIFDLDQETFMGLMSFSRKVAKAMESVIDCNRVGIAVVGLEVPHAHVHLIPLQSMQDMNFKNTISLSADDFSAIAKSISAAIVL